jgi:hypothetical protein
MTRTQRTADQGSKNTSKEFGGYHWFLEILARFAAANY